jgi:hypothetical protein
MVTFTLIIPTSVPTRKSSQLKCILLHLLLINQIIKMGSLHIVNIDLPMSHQIHIVTMGCLVIHQVYGWVLAEGRYVPMKHMWQHSQPINSVFLTLIFLLLCVEFRYVLSSLFLNSISVIFQAKFCLTYQLGLQYNFIHIES